MGYQLMQRQVSRYGQPVTRLGGRICACYGHGVRWRQPGNGNCTG